MKRLSLGLIFASFISLNFDKSESKEIAPTFQEFSEAIVKNNYKKPKMTQYKHFVDGLSSKGGITSKREAAMFLANILQESAGLTRIIEDKCGPACLKCPTEYRNNGDAPRVRYCGRGYIQLVNLEIILNRYHDRLFLLNLPLLFLILLIKGH